MYLLTALQSTLESVVTTGTLTLISRAIVAAVWVLALVDVWRHRAAPMANQAMAAALALIIGQFAFIYHQHIPIDTLFFFVAMGQVVMATAVMKMFRWAAYIPAIQAKLSTAKEVAAKDKTAVRAYIRTFVVVSLTGLVYFVLSWIELGG